MRDVDTSSRAGRFPSDPTCFQQEGPLENRQSAWFNRRLKADKLNQADSGPISSMCRHPAFPLRAGLNLFGPSDQA